jgi:hypothetical protein
MKKIKKIVLNIDGQTEKEAIETRKIINNIFDLVVKPLDSSAKLKMTTRRKCDYCQKTLNETDNFKTITIGDEVLDKCEECQNGTNTRR